MTTTPLAPADAEPMTNDRTFLLADTVEIVLAAHPALEGVPNNRGGYDLVASWRNRSMRSGVRVYLDDQDLVISLAAGFDGIASTRLSGKCSAELAATVALAYLAQIGA